MRPPTVVPTCAMIASAPAFAISTASSGVRDIDDAEQVHPARERHHLEFLLHAHAGLFEHPAEVAIDDRVGGKIVHAGEAHLLHLAEPVPHAAPGIGRVHAANHRHFLDDRQHLVFADLHGDRVRVAVGHHSAGRAVAHHAEAAGIVNDDEVGAALAR